VEEEYLIQMGPVVLVGAGRNARRANGPIGVGARFRAVRVNGWGPRCWHTTVDTAIDCLEARISEVLRPALLEVA